MNGKGTEFLVSR